MQYTDPCVFNDMQVHGLCGNNDGSTQGDLELPSEAMVAGNHDEFGSNWVVSGSSCSVCKGKQGPSETCSINKAQESNGKIKSKE